ncbi:MAG TPA: cytochrome c3 family protein [Gemmataceae bacterium]|nr:cytochrome c3 family protein [Gemmataceae bacterium]
MGTPSPSRMRADKLVARRRYFRGLSWMEAACVWLIAGGVALVAAWFIIAQAIRPDPSRYSPGELSQVHAAWEKDCDACHKPQSVSASATNVLAVQDRWRDFTCEKCHGDAEHTHISKDSHAPREHCADCHVDHGGKLKSLTALADANCTRCHADLKNHATETPGVALTITDFFSGHPEFKKLDKEFRRKLTFSHSLHMTAGLWYGTKSAQTLKVGDIPESFRERYRMPGAKDDDAVKLDCQSCHRLDGSTPKTVRGEGRHMAPMSFDHDCKACHSLKTNVAGDDAVAYSVDPPHGQQPAVLAPWLSRELTLSVVQDQTKGTDIKLFGGRLDPRERAKVDEALKPRVEALTNSAQKKLFGSDGTCAKCHEIDAGNIVPPAIPTVWFQRSWFDHSSHRALECAECHPGKAAVQKNGVTELGVPEPLGIRGIESCRKCHGPTSADKAGVRASCVDCHRYHNGDHPLQGRGAAAFDPPQKVSITEWIKSGR